MVCLLCQLVCGIQQETNSKGSGTEVFCLYGGVAWFQARGKWRSGGSVPTSGTIVFFDWDHDGASDHVGIVEKLRWNYGTSIEGNSGDAVKQNSYTVNSQSILGIWTGLLEK